MNVIKNQNAFCISNYFFDKISSQINNIFSSNINGERILRVTVNLDAADLVSWLNRQKFSNKFYWNDSANNFETACVGSADTLYHTHSETNRDIIDKLKYKLQFSPSDVRYYGAMNFSGNTSKELCWKPFSSVRFTAPRFELIKSGKSIKLSCNVLYSPKFPVKNLLDSLRKDLSILTYNYCISLKTSKFPSILSESSIPVKSEWYQNFSIISNNLYSGIIDKIVLARKKDIYFENQLNGCDFLAKLNKYNPKTVVFGYQPEKSTFFLGASPEFLYERKKNIISSHAVAGTRLRGDSQTNDHKLEFELLESVKELNEHMYVQKYFENSFNKLCTEYSRDIVPSVLKISMLQHLYCEFNGILHPKVTDSEILDELHPSPAVGGCPKPIAVNLIKEIEPFERGLYASPIGWFSKDNSKFVVGIRSALIHHNLLSIYAGAGIVRKSDAENEWQEIEYKLNNFTRLFK